MFGLNKKGNDMGTGSKKVITTDVIRGDMDSSIDTMMSEVETLVKTVEAIEKPNENLMDRGNRMKSIGFTNTPSAKKTEVVEIRTESKRNTIKTLKTEMVLVAEYAIKYPTYKFVPTSVMVKVMKKYGLFLGKPKWYAKDIPEKNLQDIERFEAWEGAPKWFVHYRPPLRPSFSSVGSARIHREVDPEVLIAGTFDECGNYASERNGSGFGLELGGYYRVVKNEYRIAAPIDHFDFGKDRVHIDEKTRKISKEIELKDPIVFVRVKGGALVVTAWDEEAEDIDIINPIMN